MVIFLIYLAAKLLSPTKSRPETFVADWKSSLGSTSMWKTSQSCTHARKVGFVVSFFCDEDKAVVYTEASAHVIAQSWVRFRSDNVAGVVASQVCVAVPLLRSQLTRQSLLSSAGPCLQRQCGVVWNELLRAAVRSVNHRPRFESHEQQLLRRQYRYHS